MRRPARRNRTDDHKALDQAHDLLVKVGVNCKTMINKTEEEDESTAAEVEVEVDEGNASV